MSDAGMTTGDQVRVYPHGRKDLASTGEVLICSGNQRSIAVGFADKPAFGSPSGPNGMFLHPAHGLILLASRVPLEVGGTEMGPWVELASETWYVIEPL